MSATSTGLGRRRRGILGPRWDDRDVFTLEETSQILRLSRPTTYAAVKKGEIPTIKLGSRLIVPRSWSRWFSWCRWREPSEKQAAWLAAIAERLTSRESAA